LSFLYRPVFLTKLSDEFIYHLERNFRLSRNHRSRTSVAAAFCSATATLFPLSGLNPDMVCLRKIRRAHNSVSGDEAARDDAPEPRGSGGNGFRDFARNDKPLPLSFCAERSRRIHRIYVLGGDSWVRSVNPEIGNGISRGMVEDGREPPDSSDKRDSRGTACRAPTGICAVGNP